MEGHLDNMAHWANPANARAPKESKDDASPGSMDYLQSDWVKTNVYLLRACEVGGPKREWTPRIGKGLLGKNYSFCLLFSDKVWNSVNILISNCFIVVASCNTSGD